MKTSSLKAIHFFIVLLIILSEFISAESVNLDSTFYLDEVKISENKLKILSWNIKMLPGPFGWFLNRKKRAEKIVQFLNNSNEYDIIFFQEAFSGNMRKRIFSGLVQKYPHQIEPEDKKNLFKSNSGLWAISRLPIMLIDDILFSQLRDSDKLASKGAKLYSVLKNKRKFHFINTHLQSDYEKQYADIRIQQYTEIYDQLILPNDKENIPLILCGDLNIFRPAKLKIMLHKLKLKNGPLLGNMQHSLLGKKKHLVDYILVKKNHFLFKSVKRRIIDFSIKPNKNKYIMSDHYPVEAIISW